MTSARWQEAAHRGAHAVGQESPSHFKHVDNLTGPASQEEGWGLRASEAGAVGRSRRRDGSWSPLGTAVKGEGVS